MGLEPSILIYLLLGVAVAVAVYLTGGERSRVARGFAIATAVPFWPLYVPLLLAGVRAPWPDPKPEQPPAPDDAMEAAIRQVDAELEAALCSLDGWAEDVLAREHDRMHELHSAWRAQSERIREMDRLLMGRK